MKPVLMLHEIREELFSLPLQDYILTFDDGLYSQYYYYPKFREFNTELIYFISSNILCTQVQSSEFPTCEIAHEKAFQGNKEDYMTIEQVKELMKDPLVTIGAHSHNHTRLNKFDKFTHKIMHIGEDTKLMMDWFKTNLNYTPCKFCFPYNEDMDGMYKVIAKSVGFTEFYGKERCEVIFSPNGTCSIVSHVGNTK